MNKVKILIFSLVYYPEYVGGAELAIHEITKRISHESISFHLVTLRGNAKETIERIQGVTVFRVGWKTNNKFFFKIQKILFPFLAYFRSLSLHKENTYTHAWSMMANQAGFAGLFFKLKFKKIRFILTLQEGDPIPSIKRKVFFVYPLFKMIFTKADVVTAISGYLKEFGHSMGAKRVVVIPNGVDLSLFSQDFSSEEQNRLLQKLSLSDHHRILVTTSRLVKKKWN